MGLALNLTMLRNHMAEESLSEKIARHNVALQCDRIPADVIAAAKLHILDSIGCLLAGTALEPGKLAYDMANATSGSASTSTLFGAAGEFPISTLSKR